MLAGVEADGVIAKLGLEPLPVEGGWFVETYRSEFATAIYYLLTPDTVSRMHRLNSDEVYHFYAGDPVEMLLLYDDGTSDVIALGSNIEVGQRPQVVVPRTVWQGCKLVPGGRWALMGTTVAPAFNFDDFELADPHELLRRYPDRAEMIRDLTPGRDNRESAK